MWSDISAWKYDERRKAEIVGLSLTSGSHLPARQMLLPLPLDLLRTLSHFFQFLPIVTFLGNIGSNISIGGHILSIYCHIFPRGSSSPAPDALYHHWI